MHSPSVFLAILSLLPEAIQCHQKWKPFTFMPFSHSTWQCFCVLLPCLFSLNVWFYTVDMQSAQTWHFVCCFALSCYSIITQENIYSPKCMWPWVTSQLFVLSVSSCRRTITPTPWVTGSFWLVSSHHTKNLHVILGRIEWWKLRRRAGVRPGSPKWWFFSSSWDQGQRAGYSPSHRAEKERDYEKPSHQLQKSNFYRQHARETNSAKHVCKSVCGRDGSLPGPTSRHHTLLAEIPVFKQSKPPGKPGRRLLYMIKEVQVLIK